MQVKGSMLHALFVGSVHAYDLNFKARMRIKIVRIARNSQKQNITSRLYKCLTLYDTIHKYNKYLIQT